MAKLPKVTLRLKKVMAKAKLKVMLKEKEKLDLKKRQDN